MLEFVVGDYNTYYQQIIQQRMNIQQQQGMQDMEEPQTIDLKDELEDEIESFGDLDRNDEQDQRGQRIVIDEDTMESNDQLINHQNKPIQQPTPKKEEEHILQHNIQQSKEADFDDQSFYRGLIGKLRQYNYDQQSLQDSYSAFEAAERKYLLKIKIIYSHFLINDRQLTYNQFNHLKTLLFVPNYGESLVRWGNKKYGYNFTLPLVLQRLDHMEKLAQLSPKKRCKQEIRLLVMLVLLLLIIRLLS